MIPLAPLARTITVSLVDRQPSESTRSKLTAGRRASAPAAGRAAATTASVVRTTSIVARLGASMPGALGHAADASSRPAAAPSSWARESVVMIARAASGPPSSLSACTAAVTPAVSLSMGSRTPISPVLATATSIAPRPSSRRGVLGGGVGVLEALGPGAGVGAAGVEDDGARPLAGQHLPAPEHRRGREAVGGEDGGRGVVRAVVEDDGDVGVAGGLEPGGDAGGARSPSAARDGSRRDSYEREAGGLGQAEGEVGALQRRSRRCPW